MRRALATLTAAAALVVIPATTAHAATSGSKWAQPAVYVYDATSAGSLYAALDRMVRSGWIAEKSAADSAGAPQRRFAITRAGRAVARAEALRLAAVIRQAQQHKLLPEGT